MHPFDETSFRPISEPGRGATCDPVLRVWRTESAEHTDSAGLVGPGMQARLRGHPRTRSHIFGNRANQAQPENETLGCYESQTQSVRLHSSELAAIHPSRGERAHSPKAGRLALSTFQDAPKRR
jgi:hypothetical protein